MSPAPPDATPRERIAYEVRNRGRGAVIESCVALLQGAEVDADLILTLGGAPATWVLDQSGGGQDYWLRVWAARGLLWAWDDTALDAVVAALADEAWRVREMAAKVVARHLFGDALPAVLGLREDPVPRVRAAAERAVVRLTAAGV